MQKLQNNEFNQNPGVQFLLKRPEANFWKKIGVGLKAARKGFFVCIEKQF